MGLMPSMLSILSEKGLYEGAKEYNLLTVLNAAHALLYALQKADSAVCKTGKVADKTMKKVKR